MHWLYRLQQRLAITDREALALSTVTALLLLGLAVRYVEARWHEARLPDPVRISSPSGSPPALAAATDTLPSDSTATPDTAEASPGSSSDPLPAASGEPAGTGLARMNLNTASAAQLRRLPGIGPRISERIVAYRTEHGPFARVDDLARVKGIGPKTLERLRPMLFVEG